MTTELEPNTKIKLTDGTTKPLKELQEEYPQIRDKLEEYELHIPNHWTLWKIGNLEKLTKYGSLLTEKTLVEQITEYITSLEQDLDTYDKFYNQLEELTGEKIINTNLEDNLKRYAKIIKKSRK